ncbi:MAG: RcpC/CpaB family pilus assembly protein [Actinomycetes bacterium]
MLRRSPRAVALWCGAAMVALATTTVVAGDLATLHRRAGALGPERDAVVARHDLALGATISPDDVTTRRIHASQLPAGTLVARGDAVGHVVTFPVLRGGFVGARTVVDARRGISAVLPPDTRALRVVVDGGLRLHAGEAVDVYAGSVADPLGTGRTSPATTGPVVQGAIVLALDPGTGAPSAGAFGAATSGAPTASGSGHTGITLLVDRADAGAVVAAATRGPVLLALVPPEDARPPSGLTPR